MGRMATSAGKGLGGPEFRSFFAMMKKEGGPTLRLLGGILGNVAKAFAGLAVAFAPISKQVLTGLESLTARFAAFANEGEGGGLQKFVDYVREHGPKVAEMLGAVGRAVGRIVVAIAPFGEWVVQAITDLSNQIARMPIGVLRVLIGALAGITLAYKAATTVAFIHANATKLVAGAKRLATAATNGETLATIRATVAEKAKLIWSKATLVAVSYTHLRAHET